MTDIKTIAATCSARIFDRMEMCKGSAILKSDIERDIEQALRAELEVDPNWPGGVNINANPEPRFINDAYRPLPVCVTYASVPSQVKENAREFLGFEASDFIWTWKHVPGNSLEPRDRHHWYAQRGNLFFEEMTLAQDT